MTTSTQRIDAAHYTIDLRLGTRIPRVAGAPFPRFVAVLHAMLDAATERATCIVLPRPAEAAYALAVSASLGRFRRHIDGLLAEYGRTEFRKGELVRVLPKGLVYEFDGYFPERLGDFFKLRVLNRADRTARACDATEILRLQRTNSRTPRGTATVDLGTVEITPLDRLLGVRTFGNASIYCAEVLLQSSRSLFEEFLENITPPSTDPTDQEPSSVPTLASVLPWGTVREDGSLAMHHDGDGTPLCSVTDSSERLHQASDRMAAESLWVIIEGAHRVRNVEQLHSIADRQRVLVVAGSSEIHEIEQLRRSGILVWQPEPEELLTLDHGRESPAVGAGVLRAAAVARDMRLLPVAVQEELLDRASRYLREAEQVVTEDTDVSAREAIDSCYGLLLDVAEWYAAPPAQVVERTRGRLHAIRERLHMVAHFLAPSVADALRSATESLNQFISRYELDNTPKVAALAQLLDELRREGKRCVIAVRSTAAVEPLVSYVGSRWPQTPVERACSLSENGGYDVVVLASWPLTTGLDEVIGTFVTPDIRLIGYDYERRWLSGYELRRERVRSRWGLGEERRHALGLPEAPPRVATTTPTPPSATLDDLLSAIRLESFRGARRKGTTGQVSLSGEVVEGRYVGFVGKTYAYLTPTHRMPRLNTLLRGGRRSQSAVEHVSVESLQLGDLLLFRDAGDSDVISLIAEQIYGESYLNARRLAEEWRPILRRVGTEPFTVHKQLRRHGLTQQLPTVQGWMRDPSRIGPQNEADLRIIADAAKDRWLYEHSHEVYEAIREVRADHISAGSRLTDILLAELPAKLRLLGDGETRLELNFGDVWVVQVENISPTLELRSYFEVNRLLWDTSLD